MKLALVTTAPSIRSGIGDYTRHLLPYLREHCQVDLYVAPGTEEEGEDGELFRSAEELDPKAYDQLLYQIGNEQSHSFMPRMIRAIGGTVMQHDWVLFDMALATYKGLERGGLKGHALAMREGGAGQARTYLQNWLRRRRQRSTPVGHEDTRNLSGVFLTGWYPAEGDGRWTGDRAVFRLPARGCERVAVTLHADGGRTVELHELGQVLERFPEGGGRVECAIRGLDEPPLTIEIGGIQVTEEQRKHGDSRRLGCFVQKIEWEDGSGWHELDLSLPAALPIRPVSLDRDRFDLPFNRSIVRFADSFIVHSEYVRQLVLRDRNSHTPVGILPHGAEKRWRDEDRAVTRGRLGLDEAWQKGFLLVSFGGVQEHKRMDKVLEGLALARKQRPDIRFLLAGGYRPEIWDPVPIVKQLGLADAVELTGWVTEEKAWDCIHSGDVSINLRGPTSGGTSGGIYQSLAFGRGVIATGEAEQAELPDDCIPKVPLGDGEVEAIARLLVELRDDPDRRVQLEAAARRYVEEDCHWSHTARQYAEYLEAFPGPRATRKSLIGMRIDMAKRRGQAAG